MRVNVYAEEISDRVELVEKRTEDGSFVGVRFYLELPVSTPQGEVRGPFFHGDTGADDDSSAVTFWGKRALYPLLVRAVRLLNEHRDAPHESVPEWAVRRAALEEVAIEALRLERPWAPTDPRPGVGPTAAFELADWEGEIRSALNFLLSGVPRRPQLRRIAALALLALEREPMPSPYFADENDRAEEDPDVEADRRALPPTLCDRCRGRGVIGVDMEETCPSCHGFGRVRLQ